MYFLHFYVVSELLVLSLELSDHMLQVRHLLVLCVLLYFVLDLLSFATELERQFGLFGVVLCWGDVDEHKGLGVASDRISHQLCQHVLAVSHELVRLALC